MKFVYSDRYHLDIGAHVFPMEKYRLVKAALDRNRIAQPEDFIEPVAATPDDIRIIHTDEYLDDLEHLRSTPRTMFSELPLTSEIVKGYYLMAGGTGIACETALREGIVVHLGGGFHHAFADHAEGFCYINDIAVALGRLLRDGRIGRACVIDCDLHQGNGTARIFHDDKRVFTFSIHQESLYPPKQKSDWDIGLDIGTGDDDYLRLLDGSVKKIFTEHKPDLAVYVAGADPFQFDQLGGLKLTKNGLRRRDELVVGEARGRQLPVAVVLAGGYAFRIEDTVDIHYTTCLVCTKGGSST